MNQKENKIKKYTNKYVYIIIISIIFLISNFIIIKGLNIIDEKILIKLVEEYRTLYLIFYNLIWVFINIIQIIVICNILKNLKLNQKDSNIIKNIITIIFVMIISLINNKQMNIQMFASMSLVCILLLAHAIIIWYLFVYVFEKKYKSERLKIDLISLIISTIIIFFSIYMYEFVSYKKTTINCVRSNKDIVNIRVNTYGVENIKLNGKFISEKQLENYNLKLIVDFANNYQKYENEEKLIKANMNAVFKYEKENKSTCENY